MLITKDNLAKSNWNSSQKCCFCDSLEVVQHLFISYPFVQIIWRMIYLTYKVPPPMNSTNMFGTWLNGVSTNDKARIPIVVLALCWSI